MIRHFLNLEWKAFFRSASFKTNLFFKIILVFSGLWMIVSFLSLGIVTYYIIEKKFGVDPLIIINTILIFYLAFDLVFRYFLQKMPIVNIRPLLYLPIKKGKIVNFALNKTVISFFNIVHAFFFIPFSIIMVIEGYPFLNVLGWHLAVFALIYCNNFINVFINDKDIIFYCVLGMFITFGGLMYYNVFDITKFTIPVFQAFYNMPYLAIIPLLLMVSLYKIAFNYFKRHFYLDSGLAKKVDRVQIFVY